MMRDSNEEDSGDGLNDAEYVVGYRRPPLHTRFQPGKSGNPSGRPKGSPNLKTLFEQILKEQISLREGEVTKKITKAEAILRGLVVGAMKGDSRSQMTLFKLARSHRPIRREAGTGSSYRTRHRGLASEGRETGAARCPSQQRVQQRIGRTWCTGHDSP